MPGTDYSSPRSDKIEHHGHRCVHTMACIRQNSNFGSLLRCYDPDYEAELSVPYVRKAAVRNLFPPPKHRTCSLVLLFNNNLS